MINGMLEKINKQAWIVQRGLLPAKQTPPLALNQDDTMKKIILSGFVAGLALLAFSYGVLFFTIRFFSQLVEEYYNPVFWPGNDRAILFFLHPFILSFALAWFWERFKKMFSGALWLRGVEMGIVYAVIATLPSMWITFSAIYVSLTMILSWFAYGVVQAVVAGLIFAKINP